MIFLFAHLSCDEHLDSEDMIESGYVSLGSKANCKPDVCTFSLFQGRRNRRPHKDWKQKGEPEQKI